MARPKKLSIRSFLLMLILAGVGLAWALGAFLVYWDAHRELDGVFDAQLAQSARILMARAAHERHEQEEEDERRGDDEEGPSRDERWAEGLKRYEQNVHFQVWSEGKLVVRSSPSLPTQPLSESDGYSDRTINGSRWRVLVLRNERRGLEVQVGHEHSIRESVAGGLTFRIVLPLILVLPILGFMIWWAVTRGLQPLREIAGEVSRRAPSDLTPLPKRSVPDEIGPLVDSINSLLRKLTDAFENERRFTSDAAHELRTPLAALRAQAEVALGASTEQERKSAIEKILSAVDRASRMVGQMLVLARLDREKAFSQPERISLRKIAQDCLTELAPEALAKGIDVGLEGEDAFITGNGAMISVLARNLVDNAIRYTPAGGSVEVRVLDEGGSAVLEVADSGPGIRDEDRTKVFERFYRGPSLGASGSGLGLSIAKRVVDLHSGSLEISSANAGGTRMRASFPS